MAFWVPVDGVANGQPFDDALINTPLNQLRERTDWLRERLLSLSRQGSFEAVVLTDLPLVTVADGPQFEALIPAVKDVVVYNTAIGKFCKAVYGHGLSDAGIYELNKSSYAVGVLTTIDYASYTGTVVFSGKLPLDTGGVSWLMSSMLEPGQIFMPGPYYLSAVAPGKITSNPGQRAIYVGYFTGSGDVGNYALLSPQYRDFLLGHLHSSFMLEPRTAGFCSTVNGEVKVLGYAPIYYRDLGSQVNAYLDKYYGKKFLSTKLEYNEITLADGTKWPVDHGYPTVTTGGNTGGIVFVNREDGQADHLIDQEIELGQIKKMIMSTSSSYSCSAFGAPDKTVVVGRNRLVIGGTWYGTSDAVYTFTLGRAAGESSIPLGFDDCYLYWKVNNGTLPDGRVRLLGYNIPTFIGVRYDGIATNPSANRNTLSDTTVRWQTNALVGLTVSNLTDGSAGTILSNTVNTVTVNNLVGGTRNSFQLGDEYSISGMSDSGLYVILQDNLQQVADMSATYKTQKLAKYVTEIFRIDGATAWTPMQDTAVDRYIWSLSIPDDMKGWVDLRINNIMSPQVQAPAESRYNYTLLLHNVGKFFPEKPTNTYTVECNKLISFDYGSGPTQMTIVQGTTFTVVATIDNVRQERVFLFSILGTPEAGVTVLKIAGNLADDLANLYTLLENEFSDVFKMIYDPTDVAYAVTFVCNPGVESLKFAGVTPGTEPGESIFNNTIGGNISDIGGTATYLAVYDEDNLPLYDTKIATKAVPGVVEMYLNSTVTLLNGLRLACLPFSLEGKDFATQSDVYSPTYGDKWVTSIEVSSYVAPGGVGMSAYLQYNIGADPDLNIAYPPVPLTAASLSRGGILQLSVDEFPEGDNSVFRVGLDTLYWYTNAAYYMPFPENYMDTGQVPSASDDGRSVTKLSFLSLDIGNSSVVTSLQPVAGSAVKVVRCGTSSPATVGDLAIDVDLSLQVKDANVSGAYVVKQGTGLTLSRGPVVERIISSDGSLSVVSSLLQGQGTVDLSTNVGAGAGDVRGAVDDIMLLNAKQDLVNLFPYIRLLPVATASTGYIAKFRAPYTLTGTAYEVYFYISMFPDADTDADGAIGLTISYSVLKDLSMAAIPAASDPYSVVVPYKDVLKHDTVIVTNDPQWGEVGANGIIVFPPSPTPGPILIAAGDVVSFKIMRSTPGSGIAFEGNLGIIDMGWALRLQA